MTVSFVLSAQLPSGKNQVQLSRRNGKIIKYPNRRFTDWRTAATKEILQQRSAWPVDVKKALPLRGPVALHVVYCPLDRRTRDVSGLLDALFFLFVACGLIEDDGQIQDVDWSRLSEREGPCAVVRLTAEE